MLNKDNINHGFKITASELKEASVSLLLLLEMIENVPVVMLIISCYPSRVDILPPPHGGGWERGWVGS